MKEYDICQRVKEENVSTTGFLQPLPISERNWTEITMDFIEGLPRSHRYEVILVVVDHLKKICLLLASFSSIYNDICIQSVSGQYIKTTWPVGLHSKRETQFSLAHSGANYFGCKARN